MEGEAALREPAASRKAGSLKWVADQPVHRNGIDMPRTPTTGRGGRDGVQ